MTNTTVPAVLIDFLIHDLAGNIVAGGLLLSASR
jgi:hypothetical protein